MSESVTYEGLVGLMESMVNNRESGALYLRTDTNHSICIGISQGNIEALVAGPRRGLAAIKTILSMSSGSCRRDDTPIAFHAGDLPPTAEILQILKSHRQETAAGGDEPIIKVNGSSLLETPIDTQQCMETLCALLHDYLGPVAPLICEDLTQGGASLNTQAELDEAIVQLAAEIESTTESEEFLARAREQLANSLA
jgi:hypothetical protein